LVEAELGTAEFIAGSRGLPLYPHIFTGRISFTRHRTGQVLLRFDYLPSNCHAGPKL
jgi:hypothetical protein